MSEYSHTTSGFTDISSYNFDSVRNDSQTTQKFNADVVAKYKHIVYEKIELSKDMKELMIEKKDGSRCTYSKEGVVGKGSFGTVALYSTNSTIEGMSSIIALKTVATEMQSKILLSHFNAFKEFQNKCNKNFIPFFDVESSSFHIIMPYYEYTLKDLLTGKVHTHKGTLSNNLIHDILSDLRCIISLNGGSNLKYILYNYLDIKPANILIDQKSPKKFILADVDSMVGYVTVNKDDEKMIERIHHPHVVFKKGAIPCLDGPFFSKYDQLFCLCNCFHYFLRICKDECKDEFLFKDLDKKADKFESCYKKHFDNFKQSSESYNLNDFLKFFDKMKEKFNY